MLLMLDEIEIHIVEIVYHMQSVIKLLDLSLLFYMSRWMLW